MKIHKFPYFVREGTLTTTTDYAQKSFFLNFSRLQLYKCERPITYLVHRLVVFGSRVFFQFIGGRQFQIRTHFTSKIEADDVFDGQMDFSFDRFAK